MMRPLLVAAARRWSKLSPASRCHRSQGGRVDARSAPQGPSLPGGRGETFLKAAGSTVARPAKTVATIATHPVDTTTGIPSAQPGPAVEGLAS